MPMIYTGKGGEEGDISVIWYSAMITAAAEESSSQGYTALIQ